MADKLKLTIATLILLGAVGAFYYFGDQSVLLRVVILLVALGIATAVAARTAPGAEAIGFGRGALIEVRKVVWPSGKETTQTTLIVLAMVVLMGLILWLFDTFLVWAVKLMTGQGG
ncbi:MAG: preprotein translocase subunit SecE [Thiohalomonadaceae bacterium]